MKDFCLFDKALKLTSLKRCFFFLSENDAPWKYIPTYLLANLGGTKLIKCNYDVKLLDFNRQIATFYKQVIHYWQEITFATPEDKKEVLEQIT